MQIAFYSRIRFENYKMGWTKEGENISYTKNEINEVNKTIYI
jgi:hypothetical protein